MFRVHDRAIVWYILTDQTTSIMQPSDHSAWTWWIWQGKAGREGAAGRHSPYHLLIHETSESNPGVRQFFQENQSASDPARKKAFGPYRSAPAQPFGNIRGTYNISAVLPFQRGETGNTSDMEDLSQLQKHQKSSDLATNPSTQTFCFPQYS